MQVFEDNIKQFPLTMEIEKSLRQFESALHAVSVIEGITSDLIGSSETKMTLLTNDQFKRTEKGMIVLTCSMVCQQCPQFSSIPSANRLKFLHWFYNQFALIYRSEMTVKKFTDPESSYAVIIPGGYVDFNNLEYIIDIENLEQRKQ
uniref:AraC family transcriptional regulator n=1 Tax=Meloidogyne hapla TaxID=6305 RepID=A0A1I8B5Z9_MELHA